MEGVEMGRDKGSDGRQGKNGHEKEDAVERNRGTDGKTKKKKTKSDTEKNTMLQTGTASDGKASC